MDDITEKLAALEAAAKVATLGPWNYGGSPCDDNETALEICKKHISATALPNKNGLFCEVWADDYTRTALVGHGPNGQNNAEYIALANPATILELVEHIRALEAERDAARTERCPLCGYEHGHSIGCQNNPVDNTTTKE